MRGRGLLRSRLLLLRGVRQLVGAAPVALTLLGLARALVHRCLLGLGLLLSLCLSLLLLPLQLLLAGLLIAAGLLLLGAGLLCLGLGLGVTLLGDAHRFRLLVGGTLHGPGRSLLGLAPAHQLVVAQYASGDLHDRSFGHVEGDGRRPGPVCATGHSLDR